MAETWSIELETAGRVIAVRLAETMAELRQASA
jgi:hypothetical protein